MKNIKLLYIVNRIDGPGGLERVLSIKASYLADNLGYTVDIVTLNQENKNLFYHFSNKINYHNITVTGNKTQYIYSYITKLRKAVKRLNPDIICVCDDGLKGFFVPLILNKPCPMIYERHVSKNAILKTDSLLNKITSTIKFRLMHFGGKFYDYFVVLTNGNLKEWNFKNLNVIPNPLSFFPKEKSPLITNKVIAVGKHCGQKGYDLLLQIWKQVILKHPNWILEIYGSFNPDHDFKKMANDLGLENHVKFYPPVKNIKERFLGSSIHVLSSRFEGFGMVIIEAMACGVPSISFDCPFGPSDIIEHEENGILVELGNINAFSDSLMDLIEDTEKRVTLGFAAKKSVQRYLPENIVPQWDELFKSLIKN